MKAKLLKSLRINGKRVAPGGELPVLVELSKPEFERLAAMGAVAAPTNVELKLAGAPVDEPEPASDAAAKPAAKGGKAATQSAKGASDPSADL